MFLTRFKPAARWGPALLALALAACASTTLDGVWTRPGFFGKRIEGPVMVVGVARDETVRRVYEDDMVAKLGALGVQATPSYLSVPDVLDSDDDGRLLQAARSASATYLLSTAVIGMQQEQVITQDAGPYPGWGGFYGYRGWYGSVWGFSYPVFTQVQTYNIYIAQTSLTDVAADRIDWMARTRTTDPGNIDKETRAFVDIILNAMNKAGLVAALPAK